MAAMAINRKKKKTKKTACSSSEPVGLDFETWHYVSTQFNFDLNHDPGMTLTYFTTRSTSVAHASENTYCEYSLEHRGGSIVYPQSLF